MDCKQGNELPIGLDALLACQKPRDFRLKGSIGGKQVVDIGSNDDEFWYWISEIGQADAPDGQSYVPLLVQGHGDRSGETAVSVQSRHDRLRSQHRGLQPQRPLRLREEAQKTSPN